MDLGNAVFAKLILIRFVTENRLMKKIKTILKNSKRGDINIKKQDISLPYYNSALSNNN